MSYGQPGQYPQGYPQQGGYPPGYGYNQQGYGGYPQQGGYPPPQQGGYPQGGQPGGDASIVIDRIPTTVEDFTALRDQLARTPEGGIAVFILALHVYSEDEALGLKFLTYCTHQKYVVASPPGSTNYTLTNGVINDHKSRIGKNSGNCHVPRSYFVGTSTQNGYALPPLPLRVQITGHNNPHSANTADTRKLFVVCSGADAPRPITMMVNDKGIWKAYEWSSLQVGVRRPPVVTSDPL